MAAIKLTRSHRILVGIVLGGAVVIAVIGFVGSYAAVRELAERKGFGQFAPFFPIGIDAGIVVLLALDLLLTWLRIPFPLLRQAAWLLTAGTIAFNGAVAWPDPLGVGMHAMIPILFIITVEAARHAIGRVADITADKHMEGVRLWRWLLSPVPTFRLWRRMKLWELRSYQEVIDLERDRLVYQARLRARYGRAWRRKAPVEARMPLKLARYGVPMAETAATGLAAADTSAGRRRAPATEVAAASSVARPQLTEAVPSEPDPPPAPRPTPEETSYASAHEPAYDPTYEPARREAEPVRVAETAPGPQVTVPVVPGGRRRSLGNSPINGTVTHLPQQQHRPEPPIPSPVPQPAPEPMAEADRPSVGPVDTTAPIGLPEDMSHSEAFYSAYHRYVLDQGSFPNARQLSRFLHEQFNVTDADGSLLSEQYLRDYLRECRVRYRAEMGTAG